MEYTTFSPSEEENQKENTFLIFKLFNLKKKMKHNIHLKLKQKKSRIKEVHIKTVVINM